MMALSKLKILTLFIISIIILTGIAGFALYGKSGKLVLRITINKNAAANHKIVNSATNEVMSLDDKGTIVFKEDSVKEIKINDGVYDWSVKIPSKGSLDVDLSNGKKYILAVKKETRFLWGVFPVDTETIQEGVDEVQFFSHDTEYESYEDSSLNINLNDLAEQPNL